jgi:hypothetical protein
MRVVGAPPKPKKKAAAIAANVAKLRARLIACDFGHSAPADSSRKLSPTVREMTDAENYSAGRPACLGSGRYDHVGVPNHRCGDYTASRGRSVGCTPAGYAERNGAALTGAPAQVAHPRRGAKDRGRIRKKEKLP